MNQIGALIAPQGRMSLVYAEKLLNGVSPATFGRFARVGGQMLKSNHPAFVFGHLSMYPAQVLARLGPAASEAVVMPTKYEQIFKAGCECDDDVDGTIYPPMEEISQRFFASYRAALDAISKTDDAVFFTPNPAEGRMKELFPTIGSMVCFYIGGHMQMHLGQVSAWRRAIGLPSAM